MFFWPCIMNWLYINYQLWCTDYYLFIKYYSPLNVSSLKCSSSGGYSCIHAAYGTVTLYESSWWLVGTQLEWELTGGGRLLVGVLRHPPTTFNNIVWIERWQVSLKRLHQHSKLYSIIYRVCKTISANIFEGCVRVRGIWHVLILFLFPKFELGVSACLN